MKIKIIALLLLVAMLGVMLCSCGEGLKLANNILGIVSPDEGGDTNNFSINFQIPDPNRCTQHIIVPLSAIPPTCKTPGVSAGQACSKCGTVVVAQTELPKLDHVYDGVEDQYCNTCGYEREIKCEHLLTKILAAKEATCTTAGRTQGEECIGCGKIIAGYEIIEPTAHVYDNAKDSECNVCKYVRKIECTHEVTEKLSKVAPTCTKTGLTEGKACVHCGEILVAQQEVPMTSHKEGDWFIDTAPTETEEGTMHVECTACHTVIRTGKVGVITAEPNENVTEGLTFALNEDRKSYTLVDIGTYSTSYYDNYNIVIPKYYNGKPVTKIGEGAFLNKEYLTSVIIPEGVLTIGTGAFRECKNLQTVVIPSTVTSIGAYAFYNCSLLTSITLPEGLTEIKAYTFYNNCSLYGTLTIPYGVVRIDESAFENCYNLYDLVLPSSLEVIEKKAFCYCDRLSNITLPKGLKVIGEKAFGGDHIHAKTINMFNGVAKIGAYAFPRESTINYKGTKAEWNNIIIDPRNLEYKVVSLDGAFID